MLLIPGKTSIALGSDMENMLELADKNFKITILKIFVNLMERMTQWMSRSTNWEMHTIKQINGNSRIEKFNLWNKKFTY